MDDERLDEMIQDAARDLSDTPTPPRDAMWAEIDRRREGRRGRRSRILPFPTSRVATGGWIAVAAAAVLVVGFGLGRLSGGDATLSPDGATVAQVQPGTSTTDPAPEPAAGNSDVRNNTAYRAAAANFLSRTETVLAQFAGTRPVGGDEVVHDWAKDLLIENRLLIDSNPISDPELTRLLGDLETVLAQIVMRTNVETDEDSDWIREGMEERSILLRVRSKLPTATPYPGT